MKLCWTASTLDQLGSKIKINAGSHLWALTLDWIVAVALNNGWREVGVSIRRDDQTCRNPKSMYVQICNMLGSLKLPVADQWQTTKQTTKDLTKIHEAADDDLEVLENTDDVFRGDLPFKRILALFDL